MSGRLAPCCVWSVTGNVTDRAGLVIALCLVDWLHAVCGLLQEMLQTELDQVIEEESKDRQEVRKSTGTSIGPILLTHNGVLLEQCS